MKEYRCYKPNKDWKGAASKFQLVKKQKDKWDSVCLFLTGTQQTGTDDKGNASFGWKDSNKSVTMKLESPDIGEMLCTLRGIKDKAGVVTKEGKYYGLFHKNDRTGANTTLQLQKSDYGFNIRMSRQDANKNVVEVKHSYTLSEGEVLIVLLEEAVRQMYGWGSVNEETFEPPEFVDPLLKRDEINNIKGE